MISFLYFTNWLNAWALLQLAEPDWLNWSHDKDYILGLADRLCNLTLSPSINGKPVSDFQNYFKSTVAYIKCLPLKRVVSISRVEITMLRAQTTTTHTAIPTRPGSLYPMLVPGTKCYKWTKPDALQFKWKNDHSRAMPLAAKYTRFFYFSDWKCTTCDVIVMDWVTKWQGVFLWKWL